MWLEKCDDMHLRLTEGWFFFFLKIEDTLDMCSQRAPRGKQLMNHLIA
jgi:hypothetical protein